MAALFFIDVLKKQHSFVHGTSPRCHVKNGVRKPLFCSDKGDEKLFLEDQIVFLHSLKIVTKVFFRVTQVHGNHVYVLKDSSIPVSEVGMCEADAIITHIPDCPIVVLTADCVPIIIYDPIKHVVGIVHAGRLGTQKRIFTNTVEALSREYGSKPKNLIVGMGPAIRGCCYELDEPCALPFIKKSPFSSEFINKIEGNKFFVDLPKVNRFEGYEAGILMKNIYTDGPCTSCENDRWYSYRREGKTGRLITLAMLQSRE